MRRRAGTFSSVAKRCAYGECRHSLDWDLFIPPRDLANFDLLNPILELETGESISLLGPRGEGFVQTFQTTWGVVQFHLVVPGVRIFDEAAQRTEVKTLPSGVKVPCLSGTDLLAAKEAANRPSDQDDIAYLKELFRLGRF